MVIHSDDTKDEYPDSFDSDLGTSGESTSNDGEDVDGPNSKQVRIVIIATIVTCSLLVLVVTAILGKIKIHIISIYVFFSSIYFAFFFNEIL